MIQFTYFMLTGKAIKEAVERGVIAIEPFEPAHLKDVSYTFTLSEKLLPLKQKDIIEVDGEQTYDEHTIPDEGYVLDRDAFAVGYTKEKLILNNTYVCVLSSRAACAQAGLNVILSSILAEPNTDNPLAIEIHNASGMPIRLQKGMRIVKGIFIKKEGE